MVHGSARALLTVINDVLDFSKIEANRLDIEHLPFNLPQVLRHALSPLQPKAAQQQLTLNSITAPGLSEWVLGDAGRLRQVLVNLVGNAVKFTEGGSVDVEVALVDAEPGQPVDSQRIRFTVTDTGIGMTDQQVAQVFEAFSPGRFVHFAQVWRHRVGVDHFCPTGGADGRSTPCTQPTGQGQYLLV